MIKKLWFLLTLPFFITGCELMQHLPASTGNGITEQDAGMGIKEALGQGLTRAVLQLNKTDGFFGNFVKRVSEKTIRLFELKFSTGESLSYSLFNTNTRILFCISITGRSRQMLHQPTNLSQKRKCNKEQKIFN